MGGGIQWVYSSDQIWSRSPATWHVEIVALPQILALRLALPQILAPRLDRKFHSNSLIDPRRRDCLAGLALRPA